MFEHLWASGVLTGIISQVEQIWRVCICAHGHLSYLRLGGLDLASTVTIDRAPELLSLSCSSIANKTGELELFVKIMMP